MFTENWVYYNLKLKKKNEAKKNLTKNIKLAKNHKDK